MAKTKIARIEEVEVEPINTELDNKLELIKFTSQVQSRIKDEISSDFILAKLSEKDKEGIIEMTADAYFCKKLIQTLNEKGSITEWNNKIKNWETRNLTTAEEEAIKTYADQVFDAFLTRIYMTVILNRNVPKNHLLKVLTGVNQEDEEEEQEPIDPKDMKKFLKEIAKNEKTKENE